MFERRVLGLDIGSYAVKAVELEAGLRDVRFVRAEYGLLPSGGDDEAREAAVRAFLAEHQLSSDTVVSAFPADHATQRHLRLPFQGTRRVRQALAFQIEDELPLPLSQLMLVHEQVALSPDQTDVLGVLVPRGEIERHLRTLERMDTDPRIIDVEGTTLANLAKWLQLDASPRLLLDIGHRKTTVCLLARGHPVLLRTVPIAGFELTEALARDRELDFGEAEETKHIEGLLDPAGENGPGKHVALALDQIVRETQRSVQSAVGDAQDPIAPTSIVLCGGSAACAGLPEYFQERTGLPTERMEVGEGLDGGVVLADAGVSTMAHAAALALRGSTSGRVTQINLRRDEFQYTPDLSGLRPQLQLTAGLFALLLALWIGSLGLQLFVEQSRADELQRRIATLYAQTFPGETVPSNPARTFDTRVREQRELANHLGVTGGGVSVLEILRLISERIPAGMDISLSDLRLERHSVRMHGYTPDYETVDRIRAELERVEAFREVVLSDVVTEPRRGGKSFSLTIEFEGDGD